MLFETALLTLDVILCLKISNAPTLSRLIVAMPWVVSYSKVPKVTAVVLPQRLVFCAALTRRSRFIHFKKDNLCEPSLTYHHKTNVVGTLNMLGLAKRIGARFLLTSTSEVYGDPLEHPQKETYWGNVNPIGKCGETWMISGFRC